MNFLEQTYFAYPRGITKKICNEIIEFGESKRLNEGEIGDNIKVTKIRNSQQCWLDNFWIYKEIRPFVWASNKQAKWDFDYDTIELFQFTKYEGNKKQHYTWHSDNGRPGKSVRKLSTIILLNDPKDFEVGDLEFYNYAPPNHKNKILKTNEIKQQGTIITFPSFVIHRVLPVTKGTRYSLVVWHKGPPIK